MLLSQRKLFPNFERSQAWCVCRYISARQGANETHTESKITKINKQNAYKLNRTKPKTFSLLFLSNPTYKERTSVTPTLIKSNLSLFFSSVFENPTLSLTHIHTQERETKDPIPPISVKK